MILRPFFYIGRMEGRRTNAFALVAGPLFLLLAVLLSDWVVLQPTAWKVLGLALWMITWWIFEVVPIPVTALLPMVILPLTGVFTIRDATAPYASPIIFLFMGGFLIALGLEKYNLHKRIALNLIRVTGTHANGIILGFLIATAFLSMWISNTATTVMMLPIAMSVVNLLQQNGNENTKGFQRLGLVLMLTIAYAANIGGTATIIGTPPNVVLIGYMDSMLDFEMDFSRWLIIGVPISVLLLFMTYFLLTRVLYPSRLGKIEGADEVIQGQLEALGPMKREEKLVTFVFSLTAFAWIFKNVINDLMGVDLLNDTVTAMCGGILMFLMPVDWKRRKLLMTWDDTQRLPYGILLLFGGGLTLARGMEFSGLVQLIGDFISQQSDMGMMVVVALMVTTMLFMTELMSNVALVAIFIPVVIAIAQGMNLNPVVVTIPVTIASSCAFMMPISTPPNAIVFASGKISMREMMRAGILLNVVSIIVLLIATTTIIEWVFN